MELLLKRIAKNITYTIGKLYIDGTYFCDTLEDTDRGLTSKMTINEITKVKIPHITAIPTGTYSVSLDVVSPKFSSQSFYKNLCGGKVPRLLNVPGYNGVLIHAGNQAADTDGCILVGQNKVVGQVINSKQTFTKFYTKIKAATSIHLTIQ